MNCEEEWMVPLGLCTSQWVLPVRLLDEWLNEKITHHCCYALFRPQKNVVEILQYSLSVQTRITIAMYCCFLLFVWYRNVIFKKTTLISSFPLPLRSKFDWESQRRAQMEPVTIWIFDLLGWKMIDHLIAIKQYQIQEMRFIHTNTHYHTHNFHCKDISNY